MSVCPYCGEKVVGDVCSACGAPVVEENPKKEQPTMSRMPTDPPGGAWQQPTSPAPKKSKKGLWITLAVVLGTVLLAAIILTVVCVLKRNPIPSTHTTIPTKASIKENKPSTKETEPTEKTESTEETEPDTKPTETVDPAEDALFTANGSFELDGRVYMIDTKGACYFEDGVRTDICSVSNDSYDMICSNGRICYLMSEEQHVLRMDLGTGEIEDILDFSGYSEAVLCGADSSHVYVGTQSSQEEWWGFDISAYDFEGNVTASYGDSWQGQMADGLLILSGFRTDLSPTELRVVDTVSGETLVDYSGGRLVWSLEYRNGMLYYVVVDEETSMREMYVTAADRGGEYPLDRYILPNESYGSMTLHDGVATVYDWSGEEPVKNYMEETGMELPIPEELAADDAYVEIYLDAESNVFYVAEKRIYRYAEDESLYCAYELPSDHSYLLMFSDGYVYYRTYTEDWLKYETLAVPLD